MKKKNSLANLFAAGVMTVSITISSLVGIKVTVVIDFPDTINIVKPVWYEAKEKSTSELEETSSVLQTGERDIDWKNE